MRDMFLDALATKPDNRVLAPVSMLDGPPVKPPAPPKPVKMGSGGDVPKAKPAMPAAVAPAPAAASKPPAPQVDDATRIAVDAMVARLLEAGDLYWDAEGNTYRARPCLYGLGGQS
jgi:hypothetical protein